jgi:hypothetical protein
MRSFIVDLAGDPAWNAAASSHGAQYVLLSADPWAAREGCDLLIVDGRGRFERGMKLIASAVPHATARVLVTERELPSDHQQAYLAGATRVIVMGEAEGGHAALLSDLYPQRRS